MGAEVCVDNLADDDVMIAFLDDLAFDTGRRVLKDWRAGGVEMEGLTRDSLAFDLGWLEKTEGHTLLAFSAHVEGEIADLL